MNNKLRKINTTPEKKLNTSKTAPTDRDRLNVAGRASDNLIDSKTQAEARLTIFGHSFSVAELRDISSFASELESIASESLRSQPKLPEGVLFIMKVGNGGMEVSFGGLAKR